MHLIYIILYICIRKLNNNKNQTIMKTKEILLHALIIISVFTASLLIASTLVDAEKEKYSQLKSN